MRNLFVWLVFVVAFVDVARADWERVNSETIRLNGLVTEGSLGNFQDVAKAGFSVVRLRSGGGTPRVALQIASDIAQRHAVVIIEDYCFSACANYLALAGKSLVLPCDALLGWHGSPTLVTDEEWKQQSETEGHPPKLTEMYGNWLKELRQFERLFFKSIGVKHELLTDSVEIPKLEGLKPDVSFKFDEETGSYTVTRSSVMWIPTARTLKSYGVETKDFCENYGVSEIRDAIAKRGFKIRFSSGSKPVFSTNETEPQGLGQSKP
jgi:hypothetical protein